MTLHHIKSLDRSSLAWRIWREQEDNNWPGLAREVREICKVLEIPDVNTLDMTKPELRRLLKKACERKDEEETRSDMEKMTKMEDVREEDCRLKPYMRELDLQSVRERFQVRITMNKLRANYKMDPRNKSEKWLCVGCESEVESNSHVMECEEYSELRARMGDGLFTDKGMVDYFRDVMEYRRRMLEEK